MDKLKILIVDDEEKMRKVLKVYLQNEGYIVEEASDGKEAIEKVSTIKPNLIILDVMMPKIDGWTVLRKIRTESSTPIIMLTARGEEYDKLFGFELGADDYITKPFSPKELVARVKAVIRRSSEAKDYIEESIQVGDINLIPKSRQVFILNRELSLTPKEYELLYFFMKNTNTVFTREQLLNKVWGYSFIGDVRTVDTHIKQLREKLGDYKKYIQTIWGTGYRFKVDCHEEY